MPNMYGPFHRKRGPTQEYQTALLQKTSGEIWGKPTKIGGLVPKVKAYSGPLCAGRKLDVECSDSEGIDFVTRVKPSQINPSGITYWFTNGAKVDGIRDVGDDTIALEVSIDSVYYVDEGFKLTAAAGEEVLI
jgi:hypothetical protein